jgi:hypothetical protein
MSELAKRIRSGAKAKAMERAGGKSPKLAEAGSADKRAVPSKKSVRNQVAKIADAGKVGGNLAAIRADRKQRAKKAGGGGLFDAATPEQWAAAELASREAAARGEPTRAERIMRAFTPPFAGAGLVGPTSRNLFWHVGPTLAAGTGLATEALMPASRSSGTRFRSPVAALAESGNPVTGAEGPVPTRASRVPGATWVEPTVPTSRAPDMVVTAPRMPAGPVPDHPYDPQDSIADRLNAISLGQSRMGPPVSEEAPQGDYERQAAQNMIARRAMIENPNYVSPVAGVEVPFDETLMRKRGGRANKKPVSKKTKNRVR